jgi:hypothetical protein
MATKHAYASFRPSPATTTSSHGPSRRQLVALLIAVVVVAAGVSIASVLVKPSTARAFSFLYGSMFLNDVSSPVAVDLASGKPTVRLGNAIAAVSAHNLTDLDLVPLDGGNTLMLDTRTGEFNMVDPTGFVIKATTGGVTLPHTLPATAVGSGSSAYIVQRAAKTTYVYLVSAATVSSALSTTDRRSAARAYAHLGGTTSSTASAASANGGLWVLTHVPGSDSNAITELDVPPHSNAGATLDPTPHGSVTGLSAIESATVNRDGTGGDVVGVASANSVQVMSSAGVVASVPVSAGTGVDRILPASNAAGSLAYLYHARSSGWSLVSAPTGETGRAGVVRLSPHIPSNAAPTPPAESDGRTYFIDTTNDGLWQVDGGRAESVPGAASYPFTPKEQQHHLLTGAYVIARGNRVVFNNPTSSEAIVVFSDDSHAPRVLDKRAPVAIDPAGAAALIEAHVHHANKAETGGQGVKNDKPTGKAPTKPPPAVDNRVDCRTADQVPHVPKLSIGERAARSIELSWTYPTPDPTDCAASTFVINARTMTAGAPQIAPHTVVNHGFGATLSGLYPSTEYAISVTAYIHSNSATSPEIPVQTGPEGPQAPTGVSATPDGSGNWTVSWTSCGGVAQGCVQSTSWTVVPSFCDSVSGLYANPDKLTITADPTEHSFRTVYPGSDALLGRALCFRVEGTGKDGTIGDISASTAPAYSWRPPVAGAFHLTASRPASTSLGASASTDLTLDLGANPVRDVGGVGATVTFLLHGPNGTQTSTATVDGHSQRITASFPGIKAGRQYTAQAKVSAPRHPDASVTVNGGTVSTRANWPQLGLTPHCVPTDPNVHLACTLSVGITGLSSATADGERFSLSGNSYLRCGETYQYLHQADFDPSLTAITSHIDLLSNMHGVCSVSIQLIEGAHQADPPLFGGTASPTVTQSVDLGQATTLDATAGDFAVSFSHTDGSSVDVAYTGRFAHDDVAKIAQNWHEQIYAPNGAQCGGDSSAQGGQPEVFVDILPFDCILDQGNQTGWTITVSYTDAGTSTQHVLGHLPIAGTPPGYIPQCTVSQSNFDAHWSGTYDNPSVTVDFSQNGAVLDGCSNWAYQVNRSGSTDPCGNANAPVSQLPIAIGLPPQPPAGANNCDILTSQWNVGISFQSARTGDHTVYVPVSGTAPPAPPPTTTPPPPTTTPPTTPPSTPPSSPTDTPSPSDTSSSPQ